MSDVKDEIDWEWTGNATTSAQSNYFFLGYANYTKTNGGTHDVTSGGDTSQNFHTYSLNWQEDKLEWLIDGNSVRTLNKADTFNEEAGQYWYPSTPSRVQISIWPAGIDSSAAGTVAWAGGMIDWSDPDYVAHGYFYNTLQSVKISCADQPDSDTTGYAYLGNDSSNVPVSTGQLRGCVRTKRVGKDLRWPAKARILVTFLPTLGSIASWKNAWRRVETGR